MSFRVIGLSPAPFQTLFTLSDAQLAKQNILSYQADGITDYPCRISLRKAGAGEKVLLLNYLHQPGETPYQSKHAIYIASGSTQAYDQVNQIPDEIRQKILAIRAFDAQHMMVDADVAQGDEVEPLIERLLSNQKVSYLQMHYARRGCYAARIERA